MRKSKRKEENKKKSIKNTIIRFVVWAIWILTGIVISLVRGDHFFKEFSYIMVFIIVPPIFIFPVLRKLFTEYISNNILEIFR
jgi:heme/copper-type cytochrome/quinol oxidase subunit 4